MCSHSSDQDHLSIKIMQMGSSNKPYWTLPPLISSGQIIQRKIHSHTRTVTSEKDFHNFHFDIFLCNAISTSSMQAPWLQSSTKPSVNLNRILPLLTCFEAPNSSLFWLRIQNYKLPIKKIKNHSIYLYVQCACNNPHSTKPPHGVSKELSNFLKKWAPEHLKTCMCAIPHQYSSWPSKRYCLSL